MMQDDADNDRVRIGPKECLIVGLLMFVAYLASYPVVVRMSGGWRTYPTFNMLGEPATVKRPVDGYYLPMYRPADWLIDNTILQDPMWWWAEQCGVRSTFTEGTMWRVRE